MSSQKFFLDAANRQNASAQSYLAGHRDILSNGLTHQCGSHRRGHGNTGRRAVLGNRALWNVNVQVALANEIEINAKPFGARLDAGQRSLRRFLHDVSKLAGQRHCAAALYQSRFDLEDFAAHLCPGKTGCQADFTFSRNPLLAELDWSKHLLHALGANQILEIRRDVFTHEFPRYFATTRSDLALEIAHA